MAKLKLNLQDEFNFILIAIVTSEPIYRLGWLLNESLKLNLTESKPIQLYNQKKKAVQDFNVFTYCDANEVNYELIHNKGSHGLLIDEQKQIDFYLKISKHCQNKEEIFTKVKAIKNITLTQIIEPGLLKSKNRFLYTISED